MIRGRRKSARFVHDEWTEWLNDLEANGASLKELDDAFAHAEALDQYDEGGAIIVISAHERTIFCGSVDPELTADDLPEQVRYLAGYLRSAYTNGIEIEVIWDVTTWFRVTAWGRQAEVANEYLTKGRQVYIEGRLRLESYTDCDGNPRSSLEVNAIDLHFLGRRDDSAQPAITANAGRGQIEAEEADETEPPPPAKSGRKSLKRTKEIVEAGDEIPF